MTDKCIIYTDTAEGDATCICYPIPLEEFKIQMGITKPMTEDEYFMHIMRNDIPSSAIHVRVAPRAHIPSDRAFRNALKNDLTHDKQKCIDITKDRLRKERAPLFAELDAQALREIEETGSIKPATKAEKQRLRDITKGINAGLSLEELKKIKVK